MASIAPQGGMLLELELKNHQLISARSLVDARGMFMGSVLAPWPNRLRDGKYQLGERRFVCSNLDQQQNANHGLVADRTFRVASRHDDFLNLEYQFGEDSGYPFKVLLSVEYLIQAGQLTVAALATNQDLTPAPFAIGFHPYFLLSDGFELTGGFSEKILTDERMLPAGRESISGLRYSGGEIDDCFFGADSVTLNNGSVEVEIVMEENLNYFMFYRPGLDVGANLLAIEPMSHPANIFQDDIASTLLEPGEARRFQFSIRMR